MAVNRWFKDNLLFVFTFLGIFIFKLTFLHPSLSTSPQMWAEGATNFYFHAKNTSFWTSLFVLDYGYWPLLQRLVANFLVAVSSGPEQATNFFQYFTIFFISFSCAFPCLKSNQSVIPNGLLRLFFSLLLFCNNNYELHTFINFPYWGFIVVLFFTARYYLEDSYNITSLQLIFVAFILLSKAISVAFLPCFLLLAILKKTRWPAFVVFFAGLVQMSVVLFNKVESPYVQPMSISVIAFNEAIYFVASFFALFTRSSLLSANGLSIFLLLITLGGYLKFILKSWKDNKNRFWFHIAFLSIHAASIAIVLKGYTSLYLLQLNGWIIEDVWFSWRVWLISSTLLLVIFFNVLDFLSNYLKGRKYLFFMLFSGFLVFQSVLTISGRTHLPVFFPDINHSLFSLAENSKSQCIPINPFPWFYTGQCHYIPSTPLPPIFSDEGRALPVNEPCINLEFPNPTDWNLMSIHLLFNEINFKTNIALKLDQTTIETKGKTPNLIAWDIPKETVYRTIQVCGIDSISKVANKPYFLFLGNHK